MRSQKIRNALRNSLEARQGQAYNEEAFRYLLAIERVRSERSGCPFVLLLVDLMNRAGEDTRIDSKLARCLFSNVLHCVRETDFVGWSREDYAVGAVLTTLDGHSPTAISSLVAERVRTQLRKGLASDVAPRLHVRLYHCPELAQIEFRYDLESVT